MPHTVSWRVPDELYPYAEAYKQRIGGSWTDALNHLIAAEQRREEGNNTKEQYLEHIRAVVDMNYHLLSDLHKR